MALNDTVRNMRDMLAAISVDLEKAVGGNKAASQRVRTGTIRLEKAAKGYRKESISAEKSGAFKKSAAPKKKVDKAKPAKAKASAKTKSAPAKKKRATAKIPTRK